MSKRISDRDGVLSAWLGIVLVITVLITVPCAFIAMLNSRENNRRMEKMAERLEFMEDVVKGDTVRADTLYSPMP